VATPFTYDMPYPSQRMPVFAGFCVATSQPLAAQAGLRIMQQGGNAIDAAIATAATLVVVEPTSNGIGSDNFALIWSGGDLHGLNASGRSAKRLDPTPYLQSGTIPARAWDSVTVPGAVSGWAAAHARFGRLPFEQVLKPAIEYARNGYLVSPLTASAWAYAAKVYDKQHYADWHATFAPGGHAPQAGEIFHCADMADSLEAIASTKGEAFYRGGLADAIARAAEAGGSALRKDDLAEHRADWVQPMSLDYHGYRVHELPPNGQGLAALIALGILLRHDLSSFKVDSARSLHLQIEAMKIAFADAHRYIADPDFMDSEAESLLDDGYLDELASLVDPEHAQDFKHGQPKPGGTVLLTTADDEGNMVTWIQSNYMGFGSGIVVPGTGISLQNRGHCFSTEAGHPNQIAPGKRPYHTIIPGFVTRVNEAGQDQPLMAFGVMGGFTQPQGHVQVIVRMADYKQNPQAALDAPRWRVESGMKVVLEPGFDPGVIEELKAMGHEVSVDRHKNANFGRGQCIYRLEDGYLAASDLRSDGQAVGY
jgi:gamma-glutamyltranspeptidase/glutathione hydrolase